MVFVPPCQLGGPPPALELPLQVRAEVESGDGLRMGTGRAAEMDKLVSVRIGGKASSPSTWRGIRSSSQPGLQESLSQKGNKRGSEHFRGS